MVIELVDKPVALRSPGGDIFIAADWVVSPVFLLIISERRYADMTFFHSRKTYVKQTVDNAAEVHDPTSLSIRFDALGGKGFLYDTWFAHLRHGLDTHDFHDINRSP